MLSERSQSQNTTYYMIPFTYDSDKTTYVGRRNGLVVIRDWEWEDMNRKGHKEKHKMDPGDVRCSSKGNH